MTPADAAGGLGAEAVMTAPARSAPVLVTIDGPAGSGKTTLGRRLAPALGVALVDTGLLYRGVMVAVLRTGVDADDGRVLADLVERTAIEINTDPLAPDTEWTIRVDGVDAGAAARDPANATLLARLAARPEVRAALLPRQRALAVAGAVAVGRDCGTVVFPHAPVKLYLQADDILRTSRRAADLRDGGADVDAVHLEAEVAGRDSIDSGRSVAPLRPAVDAHVIDTGRVGIDAMVEEALRLCRAAGLVAGSGH